MNHDLHQAFGNMAAFAEQRQHSFSNNFQQMTPPATLDYQQEPFRPSGNFSHCSSSSSLVMEESSQFPNYQLTMGGGGPNLANPGIPAPNACSSHQMEFLFDEDISQQTENQAGDDVFVLSEMEDVLSGHGISAADFPNANHGILPSQPINIHHQQPTTDVVQPKSFSTPYTSDPVIHHPFPNVGKGSGVPTVLFQNPKQPIVSAPISDFKRRIQCGDSSGFGSAFSSPGEMQPSNQQQYFPTNHSAENFTTAFFQDSSFAEMCHTEKSHENVSSTAAFPVSQSLQLLQSQHELSPACNWSSPADQSAFIYPDVSGDGSCDDVFCTNAHESAHQPPFQSYSDQSAYNEHAFEPQQSIPNPSYQFGNVSQPVYPYQRQPEITSASQASSYSSAYSPPNVKQEESGFENDLDQMRSVTDQEKVDQKRIRNNEACRRSRRKRKIEKEKTEAKVYELTDENIRLKEKIRSLENDVKAMRGDVQRRISQS